VLGPLLEVLILGVDEDALSGVLALASIGLLALEGRLRP
jgi:hypothetical protein